MVSLLDLWLCIGIVFASKEESSEVSSHLMIVQEQIDHVKQEAQDIPNSQDANDSLTTSRVAEDNAMDRYWR